MAQTSWPFENIDTTETQFSQWARNINEGIKQGSGSELEVTAPGGGMTIEVGSGQAMIRGHYYSSTATETFTLAAADPANDRIDSVVIELDPTANTVILKVLTGTPAGSPVAPTLTQTDAGIYQIRLADVLVEAATLTIETADITDLRTYMFAGIGKWTTATRPTNPVANQTTGFNTTIGAHEFWNGSSWVGFADPITTQGDLIVGGVSGVPTRLPIGDDDQVLTVVDGEVAWADAAGGAGFYYQLPGSGTYSVNIPAGTYFVASQNTISLSNGTTAPTGYALRTFTTTITSLTYDQLAIWQTWSASGGSAGGINALAFGNNLFIAAGDGYQSWTSTNGSSWTQRLSNLSSSFWTAATFGNNLYVIGGITGSTAQIRTSTDGITWTDRTSNFGSTVIRAMTFGNDVYVAAGDGGQIRTSTDAITWTTRTSGFGTSHIYALTFGNNVYVAGGQNGGMTTSTDGTTWTTRTSGFGTTRIRALTFGNNLFVAGGHVGTITTSTDAITWTTRTSGTTDDIISLGYGNGYYFYGTAAGNFYLSTNAITWTAQTPNNSTTSWAFRTASFGNGNYVLAGTDASSGNRGVVSLAPVGNILFFADPKVTTLLS